MCCKALVNVHLWVIDFAKDHHVLLPAARMDRRLSSLHPLWPHDGDDSATMSATPERGRTELVRKLIDTRLREIDQPGSAPVRNEHG